MSQLYPSLDHSDIMDSLVLFMRNQSEFKDFDFDGSAIKELMRLLAYNAQQQGFENNFIYNELQHDSAQLRQNLTSLASRLGYVPSSKRAAKLKVNLVVTPTDVNTAPSSIVMSRETTFYATTDGSAYVFSPQQEYTATLSGGVYTFNDVVLLQGTWAISSFQVQTATGIESYVIPSLDIDTSTLEIAVRTSESSGDQVLYNQFKTAYDLGQDSQLYFLRENRNGFFEFKFGDGRFAKRLAFGNIITVRYIATDGPAGNGLTNVTPATSIGGYYNIQLTAVDSKSYGGDDAEDIESIRTLAPLGFVASGNAVTPGDYVAITKEYFPEAGDAICWGGEVNNPPKFGYVFVSVKPKSSETLTNSQKDDLVDILKQYNVGPITPIIADPEYIYVNVDTVIKYDPKLLTITLPALSSKVSDYCKTYSKQKMEKFNGILDTSKFSEFLNTIDRAITGNYTTVSYEKRFVPILNFDGSYDILFNHEIKSGSILIENFRVSDVNVSDSTKYTITDSNGTLVLKRVDGSVSTVLYSNIGTVDYTTGKLKLSGFRPNSIVGSYVTVKAEPGTGDSSIIASKNVILGIGTVTVTPEVQSKT